MGTGLRKVDQNNYCLTYKACLSWVLGVYVAKLVLISFIVFFIRLKFRTRHPLKLKCRA